ncbi:MAG: hypothetical protein LBR38_05825 [Synergistaceae bacterium]|jgi:hypothetical protein|nr:hypothetical protein [Synergistaceae bacterium]
MIAQATDETLEDYLSSLPDAPVLSTSDLKRMLRDDSEPNDALKRAALTYVRAIKEGTVVSV